MGLAVPLGVKLTTRIPLLACLCLAATASAAEQNEPDPAKEFTKRVGEYVKLHNAQEKDLPPLKGKSDPVEITQHKKALAAAIQHARASGKQGDLFLPIVQPHFRKVIQSEMKGAAGKPARKAAKDGNPHVEGPPGKVVVQVNAYYPDDAPVSTVPPSLLLRLPQLPKEVEYRFVGRHLILRDVAANLIVDFIPDVVPGT